MSKQNNSANHPSVSPPKQLHSDSQSLTFKYRAPSESRGKWWEMRIYRGFAAFMKKCGKTNGVDFGRFRSISAKSFPTVSPWIFTWGNTKRLAYDYNSNSI